MGQVWFQHQPIEIQVVPLDCFCSPLFWRLPFKISAPSFMRAFICDYMRLLFVTADCIPFNYILVGSCSFSPLVKSQANSKNPCSEFLSLTEHRFDAGLPGFWMMFAMRTAFCSNTPLHKHFVEPTPPPSRLDPKSSKQHIFTFAGWFLWCALHFLVVDSCTNTL